MFALDGYYTWPEILDTLESWATAILRNELSSEGKRALSEANRWSFRHNLCGELASEGLIATPTEADFLHHLLERWLLINFMDQYQPILCSPLGVVAKAPFPALMHTDRFDYFSFPWPEYDSGEFHGFFEMFRKGRFAASDLDARFIAIDVLTGTIKLKNITYRNYERHANYTGTAAQMRTDVDNFIKPFVGWAVCWNPKNIPENNNVILEGLGFANIDVDSADAFDFYGEHTKEQTAGQVWKCVNEAFPNGKGATTWADVEKKVGYSRRHIIRSLKLNKNYESWIGHARPT